MLPKLNFSAFQRVLRCTNIHTEQKIVACVDCRHFDTGRFGYSENCLHPNNIPVVAGVDYVTGKVCTYERSAFMCRNRRTECDAGGKWFEPVEVIGSAKP